MAGRTKRNRAIREAIDRTRQYPLEEALNLLKDLSKVKFTESVDVAVRLGIDPRKSDQVVLAETIKGGTIDFDVCIATPDAMRVVGRLGQVLGPRGLMPNPKVGTVTTDVEQAVKNAKAGQVQFRTDKGGIVHTTIGKADFDTEALKGNLRALVQELVKAKPAAAKGQYLRKIAISTTMGPGLTVDSSTLEL